MFFQRYFIFNPFKDNLLDALLVWLGRILYISTVRLIIFLVKFIYFITIGWIINLFSGRSFKDTVAVDDSLVNSITGDCSNSNQGNEKVQNSSNNENIESAWQRSSAIYVKIENRSEHVFPVGSNEQLTGFTSKRITTTDGIWNHTYDSNGMRKSSSPL